MHWLLELFGQVAFRLPRLDAPPGELAQEIAGCINAFGRHLQTLTAALQEDSPGCAGITPAEYQDIARSAAAAIARIAAIKEAAFLAAAAQVKEVRAEAPVRFGGRGEG